MKCKLNHSDSINRAWGHEPQRQARSSNAHHVGVLRGGAIVAGLKCDSNGIERGTEPMGKGGAIMSFRAKFCDPLPCHGTGCWKTKRSLNTTSRSFSSD